MEKITLESLKAKKFSKQQLSNMQGGVGGLPEGHDYTFIMPCGDGVSPDGTVGSLPC